MTSLEEHHAEISQVQLKAFKSMPSSLTMLSVSSVGESSSDDDDDDDNDTTGDSSSSSQQQQEPEPISLPQHKWNEMMMMMEEEEFSENSEDLFKVESAKNLEYNNSESESTEYWTGYNDAQDDHDDNNNGGTNGDYQESWYQSQHDTDAWIPSNHSKTFSSTHSRVSSSNSNHSRVSIGNHTRATSSNHSRASLGNHQYKTFTSSNHSRVSVISNHTRGSSADGGASNRSERSLPLPSAFATPPALSHKRRKKATGPMVWVLLENGMEQTARLMCPLPSEEASFSEDVEIQWKDGTLDWVNRDDVRLLSENASVHSRGSLSLKDNHNNPSTVPSSYHSRGSYTLPSHHSRDGSSYNNVASFHSRGSYYDDATLPLSLSPTVPMSLSPVSASPSTKRSQESPSTISPREEMMKKFRQSELSFSGRRIMSMKSNIITSDYEGSSSSDSLEDEEELPMQQTPSNNLRGKLGNMLDASKLKVPFRSPSLKRGSQHSRQSSSNPNSPRGEQPEGKVRRTPFRSNSLKRSSHHKHDTESVGDTASVATSGSGGRKKGLPAFPFSPQRRSSSLGKKSPLTTLSGHSRGSQEELNSSSFHHDQRRARKGIRKQAFKSKSADSQPTELKDNPIIVQAIKKKKRSNSAHSTPASATGSQSTKQQESLKKSSSFHHQQPKPRGESLLQKSSSFHHQQRALQRKNSGGSKSVATKNNSIDSSAQDEITSLWAEMYASSPELQYNTTTAPSTPTTKIRTSAPRSRKSLPVEEAFASPIMVQTKLDEEFHASSPEFGDFSPTAEPKFVARHETTNFHHEQRKARKGTRKKAFKSRSADAPPSEWHDSELANNASSSSLSSSMHNLIKPESMTVQSSYHHDQRKARAKAKGQKTRSADSVPKEGVARMEQLKLSHSMHTPGEVRRSGAVPRRKNSLKRSSHRLSPMSNSASRQKKKTSSNNMYRHSTGVMPNMDDILISPLESEKKKASLRMSDPGIPILPNTDFGSSIPTRNTSLSQSSRNSIVPTRNTSMSQSSRSSIMPTRNTSVSQSSRSSIIPTRNTSVSLSSRSSISMISDIDHPKRNASLGRSDGDVGIVMDSTAIPRTNASLRKSDGDIIPKRSLKKQQRNSVASADGGPKSPKRKSKSPKRNSSFDNKKKKKAAKESSGIAYLEKRKNLNEEKEPTSPVRSKRSGVTRSKSPKKEGGIKPRKLNRAGSQRGLERANSSRSVNNVDSRIALMKKSNSQRNLTRSNSNRSVTNVDSRIKMMKKSNSQRKLERSNSRNLTRSDSNRSFNNVDSRITLMKKSNSQRKLEAVARSNSRRQLNLEDDKKTADADAAVLAMLKKKKKKLLTNQQSSARKLLAGISKNNDSTDVPSAPSSISTPSSGAKEDRRKFRSSSSMSSIGLPSPSSQPSPHSSLSSPRDWNDSFVKRKALKSKLEALNDRMSTTIGVEASPGVRLRKQGSTLEERRAASRESRRNLKNAFHRMLQQPSEAANNSTADENNNSSTDLEVPMNN